MRQAIGVGCVLAALLAACDDGGAGDDSTHDPDSNFNLKVYQADSQAPVARGAIDPEFMIGTPRQEVFDMLGDPDSIFDGDTEYTPGVDYDADAYHVYMEVGLSFLIVGDAVIEFTLLNDNWITSNGLIVGMSKEQMLEILGDDYTLIVDEIKDFFIFDQYDITVEVFQDDDTVLEINILEGNKK